MDVKRTRKNLSMNFAQKRLKKHQKSHGGLQVARGSFNWNLLLKQVKYETLFLMDIIIKIL